MNHLATRVQTSVAAILLCCVANAQANDAKRVKVDIQQQPVLGALKELGEQTGLQLLMRVDSVSTDDIVVQPVSGELSVKTALDKLLQNTGLTYEFVNDRTIRISRRESRPTSSLSESFVRPFRVADAGLAVADTAGGGRAESAATPSQSAAKSDAMEQVVVTAQKREEALQQVPISISVLRGDALDRSADRGTTDALNRVAGVAASEGSQNGTTLVRVRGVSATSVVFAGSSPVGYYLDSAPFGFVKTAAVPDVGAYDLERIEVLRGPQGTLYGANAMNGLVRVLTRDADLNRFDLKARVSGSSTQDGGENYRGDAAVNVPIIEGKLAVRAVAGYQDFGGWVDKSTQRDANDSQQSNFRLKINAQPTENLSLGLAGWRSRLQYGAPSSINPVTGLGLPVPEPTDEEYNVASFRATYQFPGVTLSSMTSYIDFEDHIYIGFGAVPTVAGRLNNNIFSNVFSQELIANSADQGNWRWTFGGLYRDAKDRLFTRLNLLPAPLDKDDTSKSTAVFGQVTRSLLDGKLELTGGLRYYRDEVGIKENTPTTGNPAQVLVDRGTTFHSTTPKAVVTWFPLENLTTYLSYSEGFRSGALQDPSLLLIAPNFPALKPDKLKNYELGAKGGFMDGRIGLDAALYYIKWQDTQQRIGVPFAGGCCFTANINGSSASGMGIDLSVTVRPISKLEIGISFSTNDLTWDEPVITGTAAFPNVVLFNKGDRLSLSPKYSGNAWANYAFALGGTGFEGSFEISSNYTSKQFYRELTAPTVSLGEGENVWVSRAAFSVRAPRNWNIGLFVDNLTNEKNAPYMKLGTAGAGSRLQEGFPRPRTAGVLIDYHFSPR